MGGCAICRLLFYGVLLSSCYLNGFPVVVGASRKLATDDDNHHHGIMHHHHQLKHSSDPASTGCSSSANKGHAAPSSSSSPLGAHRIRISHRYGPCSPQGLEKSEANSRLILLKDELRVRSLMNSMNLAKRQMTTTDDFGEGINLALSSIADGYVFVATVGLGNPPRDFALFFDTGSDITWVQCEPCPVGGCESQLPLFDPSSSSSFSKATCTNESPTCDYKMEYLDGSYSIGYFAKDDLTISPTLVYPEFVFGCAQNVSGGFGGADGILGIGQGQYSLIAQTVQNFLGTFCYCLPATESSTGYLVFGVQAFDNCQPDSNQMIPLKVSTSPNGLTTYFLDLTGITIGQTRLDISALVSSSPDTIIDSGTVFTRLPPPVYSALRSAFNELMSPYPPAPSSPEFDTCYNLERHNDWTPPDMMLHFQDSIDVKLDPSAVTTREDDSRVCLAFAATNSDSDDEEGLTIIGNHQHRDLNVFYDINNGKLAFTGGGCMN